MNSCIYSLSLRGTLLALAVFSLSNLSGCFATSEKQRKEAEIQFDLGLTELRQGRIRESMNFFMQAVKASPDMHQAHNGLGLSLHLLGKNQEALDEFHKALELKEDYSEVRNNIARVYISQGRYREAIPELKKALEDVFLRERYLAESNLGWSLFQIGKEDEGMRRVMNALAQNEGYCVGYEYLGLMYKKQKRYAEALHEFSQLMERCPDHQPGHLEKGKLHLMLGQVTQGCGHLRTCRDMGRMAPVGRQCERLLRTACPRAPAEQNQ